MTRAPPNPPADTPAQADRLVDVLLQVRVERVLEQTRIAVVVLRHDDDQRVGAVHLLGEAHVLDRLALVVKRELQVAYVYQLGLNALAPRDLAEHEARDRFAGATLTRGAEDDRDVEWPLHVRHVYPSTLRQYSATRITWPSGSATRNPLRKPSASERSVVTEGDINS